MHDFGVVPEHGDRFEFLVETQAAGQCRLIGVAQTERGPRGSELARIPAALWREIGARVVRELAQDMREDERDAKKAPTIKTGANRLSALIGRELALLLWTLEEDGAAEQLEAILHGWRELAREERWWLYAKAAAPGQRTGIGWRRGLFHALSEAADSRAESLIAEKKSPPSVDSPRASRPSSPRTARPPPPSNPRDRDQPVVNGKRKRTRMVEDKAICSMIDELNA